MSANIMAAHIQLRKLIVGIEYSQRTKSIASLTVGRLLFAPVKTKHAWLISTNCLQFGFLGTRSNRMWWTKQNKSVLVEIHGATLLSGLQAALKYLLYLTKREKKKVLQKRKRHDCPLSHLSSVIFCFCLFYLNTSPFSSSQIVMCGISRPTIQGLQIQVNVAPSHSYQPEPTHPTATQI